MFEREPQGGAGARTQADGAEVIRPAAFERRGPAMLTAADIEAEYVDVLASISPRQRWAMQLYAEARARLAAESGSTARAGAEAQRTAREALFKAEAERRNAEAAAS
jgi:hypothetical protein